MKVSSFTIAQDSIDEITLLVERNQSKCSTLKHKLTTMLTHENETFKLTNQFLFDLSFDLRTILTMLDRLKVQNGHLGAELRSADATIAELNAKVASTQSNAYALDCALNEATRRNSQLTAVNKSNQNYIEELLLKLKLNSCNCNCSCSCSCCGNKYPQRQYTSFCNDSDCVGKNRSMISTTYEYDDMSVLKGGRSCTIVGDRKLNFDYDVDSLNCYGGYVYKKRYLGRDMDNTNTINNNSYMNINMNNSGNNVSSSCYYDNLPLESNRYKSVFGNKNYVPDVKGDNNVGAVVYEPQKEGANVNDEQQQQQIKQQQQQDEHDDDDAKEKEHINEEQQQQQHETNEHEDKQQQQQNELLEVNDDVITDNSSQNKINRVQKLVMEAFKDEDTVNKMKQKLGDDFESKLTNANIDEDYLDKIEQALIEINQETLDSNTNNNNNINLIDSDNNNNNVPSEKVSKRLQIAQNVKTKKQFKSPPKDQMYYKAQLKRDITDKQYHYKEYPRGWTSSKDYFVNNNSSDGKMERSTMKITNVMK